MSKWCWGAERGAGDSVGSNGRERAASCSFDERDSWMRRPLDWSPRPCIRSIKHATPKRKVVHPEHLQFSAPSTALDLEARVFDASCWRVHHQRDTWHARAFPLAHLCMALTRSPRAEAHGVMNSCHILESAITSLLPAPVDSQTPENCAMAALRFSHQAAQIHAHACVATQHDSLATGVRRPIRRIGRTMKGSLW